MVRPDCKPSRQPINMSKDVMDTSIERLHAKIAELETKIADLRIAERELLALDGSSADKNQNRSRGQRRPFNKSSGAR